ncbi:MAG: DNA-binding response regulator [Chloroflexi bacterium]|jgi:DNA-binding NarL/FixJ family response regulator|nr:DNA-binding response regulator [Chloroflexota bacterium]MBL16524.1 DNA-binding response regulator [Chloroflexota bacterium]MDP6496985.1 response regulator transcription factor [Dehalococcoidia bacterium]MQG54485.1 response regulator transcription factor [SAR202 cluster bacterium]|tara:strand:+ start:24500 stop:25159 length:660 start_codon:yes stop_codon:yes gene_type:complete
MAATDKLKILIVDDHDIVRKGLAMLVSRQEDLSVVAEAGTVSEAVEKAHESVPDVVVMDIRLPDGSGIEACREIRNENGDIKVLMLTSYSDEEAVMGSIMAGASGYLLKEIRSQEIVDAIRKVGSGQSLLDPSVTASVLERVRRGKEEDVLAQLTEQEQKILELIADGQTNREIAGQINLSDKTVKNYVSNILGKLEVSRRSQAAAFLAERRARREYNS